MPCVQIATVKDPAKEKAAQEKFSEAQLRDRDTLRRKQVRWHWKFGHRASDDSHCSVNCSAVSTCSAACSAVRRVCLLACLLLPGV